MKLNHKMTIIVSLFAFVVSGLSSLALYVAAENQVMRDIRQRLSDIVSVSATTLDSALHSSITNPSQEGGSEYQTFRTSLQKIAEASSDIYFIYTMRAGSGGQIEFVVDAETDPEAVAHLGEIYDDPGRALGESFSDMGTVVVEDDFYTDEWGTWLSGYAPFFNFDGSRSGVLGVDISAARVVEYKGRLLLISIGLFAIVLPVTMVLGFFIGRSISRPIIAMKNGAELMGQGDLDVRLEVDRRDEVGVLASSLNNMAASLKKAYHDLSSLMEKYRGIFDNALEGIFQSTADGRILTANMALAEMLGYESVEQMMGEVTDIGSQVYADGERAKLLKTMDEDGKAVALVLVMKRRDGSTLSVEMNAKRVHDDVYGYHLEGLVQDVSERLKREEADRERKAAEAASAAKGAFLANMSHEIRTPLNAVMGLTDLMRRTKLTTKQSEYLSKIKISSQSLLAIINDILDFSKIEAGRLELETTGFSLYESMANISEMFAHQAHKKDIELVVSIDKTVPISLEGDPVRLGQILINLTGNAIKFTEKGEVIITVEENRETEVAEQKVGLKFSVRDTGIGIDPERIATIFDSFTQADSSITRQFGGTGLGLSISKQLVEMMGGDLTISSVPGEGSIFSFTAVFGVQPKEDQIRPSTPMDLRGLRVLVVDDNQTTLEILTEIISSFNMHAESALSGEKALDIISKAEKPFDLILIDWKMPGLNGIETAKRIKLDQVAGKTPVVCMVSAYGREDLLQQSEKIFLDAFLHKPINQSLLFDTIMGLFGRHSHMINVVEDRNGNQGSEPAEHLAGARVLLVEDNAINQEVALEWLNSAGIVADTADNGRRALEALENAQYDLVLMDVQMPEMDGFEATSRIRSQNHFNCLPIIAMTAHALKGDREKCIEAGMDDYITKPIDPGLLFSTLAKWIDPAERIGAISIQEKKAETDQPLLDFELPGISVETGLFRCNQNSRLYLNLLRSFLNDYAMMFDKTLEDVKAGNMEEAVRRVHSVKGVAGNIGAMPLSEAASVLEDKMRQGVVDLSASEWSVLGNELTRVVSGLADNLPSEQGDVLEDGPVLDEQELLLRLKAVAVQLDDDLDAARDALSEMHQSLKVEFGSAAVGEFMESIENFDIDRAVELVKKMIETLEG